jgi:ribose 5-phosphate isomerase A
LEPDILRDDRNGVDVNPAQLKVAAARAALSEVRSGMTLGLGTGSTAEELVKVLAEAVMGGRLKDIRCTCTSVQTERLASSLGLSLFPLEAIAPLDLAIDGADEIDANLRLIKGRGGALLREKIVEQAARRFLVIADSSKRVERLGVGPLPVEVTPFAQTVLVARFVSMGLSPVLRQKDGATFVTDEKHLIVDISVPRDRDIADVVQEIRSFAGVVETGFFPTEATEAVIASAEGVERVRR